MKWIFLSLCSIQLLVASDPNFLLDQGSVLTSKELEIILANPENTYVYVPEELAQGITHVQSFFQAEDWDESSKELHYYLKEGYKIVPHAVLQNATKTGIAFVKKHHSEIQDLNWIPAMMQSHVESNSLAHIAESQPAQQLAFSYEPSSVSHDFLTGARGRKGNRGSQGSPGLQGTQGMIGPQGPMGIFSGTVLDTEFAIVDAIDETKVLQFDVQGSTATTTTIITNPTVDRSFITPDIDGTALVSQTGTGFVFIGGPTAQLFSSNAGIQYSTTTANRAQIRFNQFGNNTGIPGVTAFKSRATTIGGLAPVQPGDVIFRDSAIGVTDNLSIPLSGLISIVVAPNGVPAGQGWIATDYELQLVPLAGPANGRRQVFRITSEGIFHIRESSNTMAGVATTIAGGTVTVANTQITATSRITLTIQDGGTVPTGFVYVSGRAIGTSFTIQSSTNDVGVPVYYQIWEPAS